MPLGAQKLFPLKYSVLWKLSFEHFSNCRLSTFLSNQHFFDILSNRDVRLCLCASLLSSSRSDISIMSRNFGRGFLYML